jgi:hypothetical protein
VGIESLGAKLGASQFDSFMSRGLNVVKRVVEFEFLPFEAAHLMKWQDFDSFHVAQTASESRDLGNVLCIICQSGHQH